MNIKDPTVHEMTRALAQLRGISMTEAVRQAVTEALRRDRQHDDDYVDRILEIGRRAKAMSDKPFLTDDDLYDEWGLPK